PVAELETIRNEIVDLRKSEPAQRQRREGRAGRPVRVEIADDDDAPRTVREQQLDGRAERLEAADRRHRGEPELDLVRPTERPPREHLPQHGVDPRRPLPAVRAVRQRTPLDFRHRCKPANVYRGPSRERIDSPPWK